MVRDDVYSTAALDLLWGKIPFLNGVLGDISAAETDRVRAKITEERHRVSKLADQRWRQAFGGWLDHAEACCRKADEARERKPERDLRWKQMDAERFARKVEAEKLLQANPPR